jgi:hypothetical protein
MSGSLADEEERDAKKRDVFSFASTVFDMLVDRDAVSRPLPYDEKENARVNNRERPLIPRWIVNTPANSTFIRRYHRCDETK